MKGTTISPSDARDQLLADMKTVIADAEELLKATAGAAGERIGAVRTRAEETLKAAKAKLSSMDDEVIGRAKDAARATDDYVHDHPWGAVGIAAAIGLVAGVLISRR
jgi:ElaB/YqjD/DUF883 family membrane-anchored ribosome-binding protein